VGKRKTAIEYGQEIKDLHYLLLDRQRRGLAPNENSLKQERQLHDRLTKWSERTEVVVFIANNEQRPWTKAQMQYTTSQDTITVATAPMPTKDKSGYDQVGDYNFFLPEYKAWGAIVGERKSREDLYQTLFSRDEDGNWQRERFSREQKRFEVDDRFKIFQIYVEADLYDFLTYIPRFDPDTKKYNHDREQPVNTTQKRSALASLQAKGYHVVWGGSPDAAAKLYAHTIRQWIRQNYADIMGLDGRLD
jgi:hypothetical protein